MRRMILVLALTMMLLAGDVNYRAGRSPIRPRGAV